MMERIISKERPKKLIYGLMGFLLLYVVVRSLVAAAGRAFWYDELLTLTISSLGSWKAILEALHRPFDGQPPLFYIIEKFALGLARKQEIALRLPSLLAFPCTLTCVFIYVKRRGGEIVAFLCALFLLMTTLFQTYAVEARPYSMVVACIAFALVCYQRLPSLFWTAMLGFSLAAAQALHYYAIFAMVPFAVAESVVLLSTRRFRWPVWIALAFGTLPLVLFWPLLSYLKTVYGPHYWAHYAFSSLPRTYGAFLSTNSVYGGGIAAVLFAGVAGLHLLPRWVKFAEVEIHKADRVEPALILTLLALPLITFLVTKVMHGGMVDRYVLATIIGICLAVGCLLSRARPEIVALFALFVISAVGVQELHFWRFPGSHINNVNSGGVATEKFIEGAGHRELPVVVPYGVLFVELAHYASPHTADRLIYPTQDPVPNDKNWSDTGDKAIQLLQSYLPLWVSNFREFAASHKEFLIYVEEREPGRDWLTPRLVREGWSLQTVALNDFQRVYLVTGSGPPPRQ
jgi:hypothetical protein